MYNELTTNIYSIYLNEGLSEKTKEELDKRTRNELRKVYLNLVSLSTEGNDPSLEELKDILLDYIS